MRKLQKTLTSLIICILTLSFTTVFAYTVDLDDEKISMPLFISPGENEIVVSDITTNYELYYQWVQLPDSITLEIKDMYDKANEVLEKAKAKRKEANELFEIYLEERAKDPASDATYDANDAYNNKQEEASKLDKEYEAMLEEIGIKTKNLIPAHIESNWIKSANNIVNLDVSTFSGTQTFALWVKVVSGSSTFYNMGRYQAIGTKKENQAVTSVSLSRKEFSLQVGDTSTLIATISPSDATNQDVTWTSSDEKIATVNNGTITAKSEGEAKITVKTIDGDFTDTCKVTVIKAVDNTKNNSNTNNNIDNSNINSGTNNTVDNTIANKSLSKAGINPILIFFSFIIFTSVLTYYKYRKNNF